MIYVLKLFLDFMFISKKKRNNRHILEKERNFTMNKLICLMVAALMVVFAACGTNDADRGDDAQNGIVQDSDGTIDNNDNDNLVDDAADGTENIIDGATDAVDDAANGVENAVDDMTDSDKKDNNK